MIVITSLVRQSGIKSKKIYVVVMSLKINM